MADEFTIRSTLERLDRKPPLWKGLTIDELLIVVSLNLVVNTSLMCIIAKVVFDMTTVGLILGLLLAVAGVPLMAGRIEDAKKIYGGPLMWVHLKKYIQRRGWWRFDGLMTDKIEWDIRLSKIKSIQYRGKHKE